jgi:hypothetical protein
MTPEMIDWFKGYDHQIPNLTLDEFRDMVTFKTFAGVLTQPYREWEVEMSYMESQGNYNAWHESIWRYNRAYWPVEF